ncbi:S24/S26 family peptidase [uncultured Desulfuromonas sp.]|uniref:S24/S26 family peptidase n=1 Tax=uncultured Desulfuromonas sp. TaxID=181013 RepID=UPI0026026B06|nr:S24/S26 family peptidase [uncultured Desulfuromonas sp.]
MRDLVLTQKDFAEMLREVVSPGGCIAFRAQGQSMAPFICDGDRVTVRRFGGRVRRGDVVLTEVAPGNLLLHRVIGAGPGGIVTRGDALCARDGGTVPYERVLGRAVRLEGRGYNFHLRRPFGLFVALLRFVPATLRSRRWLSGLSRKVCALLG